MAADEDNDPTNQPQCVSTRFCRRGERSEPDANALRLMKTTPTNQPPSVSTRFCWYGECSEPDANALRLMKITIPPLSVTVIYPRLRPEWL